MSAKAYYQHLDVLKGVVIFLVVVGHAFHFGFAYYDSPLLTLLKAIDMPIFVFLSGLLGAGAVAFDRVSVRTYWLKKARQLLLPLLCLPLVYVLLRGIPLTEILLDKMHGGYWFTWVLWEMFVLLYIVRFANAIANLTRSWQIECLLMLTSLAVVLGISPLFQIYAPKVYEAISWSKVYYLYPYFLLGYCAGRYPLFHRSLVDMRVQTLAGVAFLLLLLGEHSHRFVLLEGNLTSLSGLIFAYATAFRLGQTLTPLNRLLVALGKESRTIYLTHYFFLFSAPMGRIFLRDLPKDGGKLIWEALLSSSYALVIIAGTLLLVKLIKGSPILALLCYGKALPKSLQSQEL